MHLLLPSLPVKARKSGFVIFILHKCDLNKSQSDYVTVAYIIYTPKRSIIISSS